MSNQVEFETAVDLAKEHELFMNGLCAEARLTELNDSLNIRGRQLLVFSNVVIELESDGQGKLEVKRRFDEEKAATFGKFAGFTRIEEKYFDRNYDELIKISSIGVLLGKNYSENKYSFVPVSEIEEPIDVFESMETDEVVGDITELLASENIDLKDLATLVRRTNGDIRDVTVLKSYLQAVALPNDLCQLVIAPKYLKTKESMLKSKTKAQHIDENYRLSIIIEEGLNIPTLCFEYDSDDGETSSIIVLKPKDIIDYIKV